MSTEVKRILKRILVTGQRLGEVAGIHANEITVERKEQKDDKGNVFREWTETWWTILVERRKVKTKSKNSSQPNLLCLSEMAFELLGTPFNGFYFSSPETKTDAEGKPIYNHIDENAVTYAIRKTWSTVSGKKGKITIERSTYRKRLRVSASREGECLT